MDLSSVDFSRAQFALTALYHYLFVPLTLGLSFIIAIMESIYIKTKNPQWKAITQFWIKLFGINFAIGVATGIIMEFEFGTNWANYSWFVGDIFGAPLAIEGLMAFFLEATFFAVMFFGWNKVSPRFHLLSTWLVAIGSNLSAFWILVANAWMQNPVGTSFNPENVRNEMTNFWDVAFSPFAISKFLHTTSSAYVLSAIFVMGISAFYLLKNRHFSSAKKSLIVGASFGILAMLMTTFSGDESAYQVTQHQPMKLAAMEGLYKGEERAGIIAVGILNPNKKIGGDEDTFLVSFQIPYALSLLGKRSLDGYVAGIDDLIYGNTQHAIPPINERIKNGKIAINALANYTQAKKENDIEKMKASYTLLQSHIKDFGYGYFENPKDLVPNIPLIFYSFHLMVWLGGWFFLLTLVVLYLSMANHIQRFRKILWACVWSIPLAFVAIEAGWIVAEVGRQPWAIQDLLPTHIAATNLSSVNIKISFFLFALIFTALLIAEIKIMLTQIKKGFEGEAK